LVAHPFAAFIIKQEIIPGEPVAKPAYMAGFLFKFQPLDGLNEKTLKMPELFMVEVSGSNYFYRLIERCGCCAVFG